MRRRQRRGTPNHAWFVDTRPILARPDCGVRGGGIDDQGENLRVMESAPSGAAGWQVRVLNDSTTKTHLFRAVVVCVLAT